MKILIVEDEAKTGDYLFRPFAFAELLARSLIASLGWDMNFDSDTHVIDVAVRRPRAKVDDDFELKLIHTVRGMGYVFEASACG